MILIPGFIDQHVHVTGGGDRMTSFLQCIRELASLGIPLEEALPLTTSNVAQALEIYPRKGLIAVDRIDADLCLMSETLEPDTVMAGDRILMQDREILVKGMF